MKNLIALAFGLALISAAIVIAVGTTSQDSAWPQVARALATELHTTPSATPPAPTATPTPIHLTAPKPQPGQILAKLFQYPYQVTAVNTTDARVTLQELDSPRGEPSLIVTGDRLKAGSGMQVASGAFAAVLSWQSSEYVISFMRVVFGRGATHVWLAVKPDGTLVFRFGELAAQLDESGFQKIVVVHPCHAPGYPATPGARSDDDECY